MKCLLIYLSLVCAWPEADSLGICYDRVYEAWAGFDKESYLVGIEDSIYNDAYRYVLNGFSDNADYAIDPNSIRFANQTYGHYAESVALNDSQIFSLVASKCPMKQILRVLLFHDGEKYQLVPTDLVFHFDENSKKASFVHSGKNRLFNLYFFYPHKRNRIIAGIDFEPKMPLPLFNTIAFSYFEEVAKKIEEMLHNGGRTDGNSFEIEEKAFRQVSRKKPDILMIDVKWGTWFFIKDGILYVRYYSWNAEKYLILPWEQAIRDKEIGTFLDDLARGRLDDIMHVNIGTK